MCSKNCCKVGDILYRNTEDAISYIMEKNEVELNQYTAFNEMFEGEFSPHENYALAYYCVKIGHVECLDYLSNNKYFMYHADLAIYAIEQDRLECLKVIVNKLGDVYLPDNLDNIRNDCRDYVSNIMTQYKTNYIPKKYL